MKKHTSGDALVFDIPSFDLARARKLILISLGLWICIGVLAALQSYPIA